LVKRGFSPGLAAFQLPRVGRHSERQDERERGVGQDERHSFDTSSRRDRSWRRSARRRANGGTLENAQAMADHASPRTTQIYDRTGDEVTLDEVERIAI
jgi:hypothetical protein